MIVAPLTEAYSMDDLAAQRMPADCRLLGRASEGGHAGDQLRRFRVSLSAPAFASSQSSSSTGDDIEQHLAIRKWERSSVVNRAGAVDIF
jgi:hypothetical protein